MIALQCFPLHRTVLMAAGLAGALQLHSTSRIWPQGGNSQRASLNQEFSIKPIRFSQLVCLGLSLSRLCVYMRSSAVWKPENGL